MANEAERQRQARGFWGRVKDYCCSMKGIWTVSIHI